MPFGQIVSEFRNILLLSEHIDTFASMTRCRSLPKFGAYGPRCNKASRPDEAGIRHLGSSQIRRARRAAKTLTEAKTATFVCFGNICRSPFAESYAR